MKKELNCIRCGREGCDGKNEECHGIENEVMKELECFETQKHLNGCEKCRNSLIDGANHKLVRDIETRTEWLLESYHCDEDGLPMREEDRALRKFIEENRVLFNSSIKQ